MKKLQWMSAAELTKKSQGLPFQKKAVVVVDIAHSIMLHPHGRRSINAKDELYPLIGKPNEVIGGHFNSYFQKVGRYKKSKDGDGRACSYPYSPVDEKIDFLVELLKFSNLKGIPASPTFAEYAQERGKSFLTNPGKRADLPRTGDRVYPWWAIMKGKYRRKLFIEEHGVLFDYDIANAKPTVMLALVDAALARNITRDREWWARLKRAEFNTWRRYVNDKRGVREELMRDLGVDKDTVKSILQGVCNGAWWSPMSSLGDWPGLTSHPIYIGLRADFTLMWELLKDDPTHPVKPGEGAGEFMSRIYNKVEDSIMQVVEDNLGDEWVWWIHDGFMTSNKVDTGMLEGKVKAALGVDITIEEDMWGKLKPEQGTEQEEERIQKKTGPTASNNSANSQAIH